MRSLLLRGLLLVGALIALTFFINLSWFDEALIPEVADLVEPRPVSMDGNAYPLVYGMPAANDRDPREAGLAIVRKLRERYEQGEPIALSDNEMTEILGVSPTDDSWRAAFPGISCNSRDSMGCAERLIADVSSAGLHDPRVQTLLARYEAILRQPVFEENEEFDVSTPIPDYGDLMAIGRIRLADAFLNESTGVFLADASQDFEFWKRMLRDGQSLIAKMVALAGIRNDLTFVSALLRERELSPRELQSTVRILEPLTESERDIGETFLHEIRIAILSEKSLAALQSSASPLTRLLLQENATLNEVYRAITVPLQLRASWNANEFWSRRGYERLQYSVRAFPPPLYNLGGKLALELQSAQNNVQDYITRVHNLDGRIALVLLQAEVVLHRDKRVEDVVRSSQYRNPFTLEPMDYDPSARTIGFDCLTERTNEVCRVELGTE